jgi:hypothetical protein
LALQRVLEVEQIDEVALISFGAFALYRFPDRCHVCLRVLVDVNAAPALLLYAHVVLPHGVCSAIERVIRERLHLYFHDHSGKDVVTPVQ